MKRTLFFGLAAVCLCTAGACGPSDARRGFDDPYGPVVWSPGRWTLVWHDEFEGAAGTPPDPTHWAHEVNGDGGGNKELQYYTDSPDNAALDGNGNLVITALEQPFMGKAYTSARLTTNGIFAHTYGRYEARMRLAAGRGMWPAFWILGDDFAQVGWPTTGEVDIMEEFGSDTSDIMGSVHGPGYGPVDIPATKSVSIPGGADQGFHVYAIEWDPQSIVFLVDDVPYFQITPARRPSYARWVWDHPFDIILNLAVGGLGPGSPDMSTTFPQTIAVDYVRVSDRASGDAGAGDAFDDAFDATTPVDIPDALDVAREALDVASEGVTLPSDSGADGAD